jgi:hypothetical protein
MRPSSARHWLRRAPASARPFSRTRTWCVWPRHDGVSPRPLSGAFARGKCLPRLARVLRNLRGRDLPGSNLRHCHSRGPPPCILPPGPAADGAHERRAPGGRGAAHRHLSPGPACLYGPLPPATGVEREEGKKQEESNEKVLGVQGREEDQGTRTRVERRGANLLLCRQHTRRPSPPPPASPPRLVDALNLRQTVAGTNITYVGSPYQGAAQAGHSRTGLGRAGTGRASQGRGRQGKAGRSRESLHATDSGQVVHIARLP